MHALTASTRGLALLVSLNWDRILMLGVLSGSLVFSTWLSVR